MSTTQALAKTLSQLAELLDQLSRRDSDLRYVEEGGCVYYGIDNDVIKDITAPWAGSTRPHLDALFVNGTEAREAFVFVFAEHVLGEALRSPFLIVPPGENELDGLWNKVYESAMTEAEDIDDRMQRLLQRFKPGNIESLSDQEIFDTIRRAVTVIYEGASSISELRRISRVAQTGAIRPLEAIADGSGGSPFPPVKDMAHDEIRKLETGWLNALRRSRRDKEISNQMDAAVLARVEWINRALTKSGSRTKLCFVTGDPHISRVAEEIEAFGAPGLWREYLRSPVCFLDDIAVFPNTRLATHLHSVRPLRLSEWLGELFWHDDKGAQSERRLSRLHREINRGRDSWTQYLRSLGASVQISKKEIESAIDLHATSVPHINEPEKPEIAQVFETLRARVSTIAVEAATGFSVSGALTRFWTLNPQHAASGGRGVPPVRFDSFEDAEELARLLIEADGLKKAQLHMDRGWIQRLQKEDGSGYTALVVMALAFGFAGEWKPAFMVSNLAYSVAKVAHFKSTSSPVKGDEAAYLCAVFGRLSASTVEELDECMQWLDIAHQLLKTPPIRKSLSHLHPDLVIDPRLIAEKLANRLTQRLFATFDPRSSLPAALVTAISTADLLRAHLEAFRHLADTEQPTHVASYVRWQLLVNAAQLKILDRLAERTSGYEELADLLLTELTYRHPEESVVERIERLGQDRKSDLIPLILLSYFASHRREVLGASRGEVVTLLRRHAGALKATPYDVSRAEAFVRLAESALA